MKKRIAFSTVLLAVATLAAAPLVLARPRGPMRGEGLDVLARLGHVREELGLTADQADQIKGIFTDLRAQNAPYREQMRDGRGEITQLLLANPGDVAAAQKLIDQQTTAERAMKTNVLNAASKALSVLDAGQRAKLGAIIAEHGAHQGRRRASQR